MWRESERSAVHSFQGYVEKQDVRGKKKKKEFLCSPICDTNDRPVKVCVAHSLGASSKWSAHGQQGDLACWLKGLMHFPLSYISSSSCKEGL